MFIAIAAEFRSLVVRDVMFYPNYQTRDNLSVVIDLFDSMTPILSACLFHQGTKTRDSSGKRSLLHIHIYCTLHCKISQGLKMKRNLFKQE